MLYLVKYQLPDSEDWHTVMEITRKETAESVAEILTRNPRLKQVRMESFMVILHNVKDYKNES